MNEPQHTPGPWRLDPDFETRDFYFLDDGILKPNPPGTDQNGPDMLAQVYKCVEIGDGRANACLIAAAPQLFAALENLQHAATVLLNSLPGHWHGNAETQCADVVEEALVILAKAKGESDVTPQEGAS